MLTNDTETASAADWAAGELYRGILSGKFSPAMRLTEAELSEYTGVSRTPLREALSRLEMVGIVSRQRNRGIRINSLSQDEMERLSMLREVLEGLVVRRVAMRHTRGEISLDRLLGIVREMAAVDRKKGTELLLRLGVEFHRELSQLSGDPMTSRILEQLMLSFERYRQLIDSPEDRSGEILNEHEAIVEAIVRGEGGLAEKLMHKHLSNARAEYAKRLSRLLMVETNDEFEGMK